MRVFISYSREDLAVVGELEGDLEAAGHTVFRDEELAGGQHWWSRLLTEIQGCDVFVFALSRTSLASKPCQLEYRYAHALGRTMLPVRIQRGVSVQELPPELSMLQLVEYQPDDKAASLALVRAVGSLPPAPPLPDPLPEQPEVPISYVTELRDALADPEPLSAAAQSQLLDELDRRLKADDDPVAIENLLRRLLRRSDTTPVARRRAKRLLGAIEAAKPTMERVPRKWATVIAGVAVTAALAVTVFFLVRGPAGGADNDGTLAPGIVDLPVDTAAAGPTTTVGTTTTTVPPEVLTTSPSTVTAPAEEGLDATELATLQEFASLTAFDAELGCNDLVAGRAFELAGNWDPAFLGTWFDGVFEWMWDPEYLAWIRQDGLTFVPTTGQYWSFCTGRFWDPAVGAWSG